MNEIATMISGELTKIGVGFSAGIMTGAVVAVFVTVALLSLADTILNIHETKKRIKILGEPKKRCYLCGVDDGIGESGYCYHCDTLIDKARAELFNGSNGGGELPRT